MEARIIQPNELDWMTWDDLVDKSTIGSAYLYSCFLKNLEGKLSLIVVNENNQWIGGFPLIEKSKFGLNYFLQPLICKYLGLVLIEDVSLNLYDNYSQKKEVLELILGLIPKYNALIINLSPNVDYALPFHWQGYNLLLRYTFYVPLNQGFEKNATKKMKSYLSGAKVDDLQLLMDHQEIDNTVDFVYKAMPHLPASFPIELKKTMKSMKEKNKLFIGSLMDGNIIVGCVIYFLDDIKKMAYLLYTSFNDDYKQRKVAYYLTNECLKEIQNRGFEKLDFAGLMVKGFENFWRKFGQIPVPYIQIRKFSNKIIPLLLRR